jgi:hypothetical protein
MNKHTPGPWEVYKPNVTAGWGLCVGTDTHILFQHKGKDSKEIKEANARLIAAAPDLLEALESIVGGSTQRVSAELQTKAQAAIAKAKGE